MPNHTTHETLNIIILIPLLFLGFPNTNYYSLLLFSVGYVLCTFFVTPDLDTNSRPYHRWKVFRTLWWPYNKLFKHRGISHHCVWGPVSLIVYCAIIFAPIGYVFIPTACALCAIITGMVIAIEMHILADRIIK